MKRANLWIVPALMLASWAAPGAAKEPGPSHRLKKDRTDYGFWPIAVAGEVSRKARYLSMDISVPRGTVFNVCVRERGGETWYVGLGYTVLDGGWHRVVFGLGSFPGRRPFTPRNTSKPLVAPASRSEDRGLPKHERRLAPRGDGVLSPGAIEAVELEFPATLGWTGAARPSLYEVKDIRFEESSPRERLLQSNRQVAVAVRFGKDLGPLNPLWKDACLTSKEFAGLGQRLYKVFGAASFGPFYAPAEGPDGAYHWTKVDRQMALAGRFGREVQVVIGRDVPRWLWAKGKEMEQKGSQFGPWKRGHMSAPANLEAYGEVVFRLASQIQRKGPRRADSFLIWGGCDGSGYFRGTIKEFLDVYETCARAIRRADSKVAVGGPSPDPLFSADWVGQFIDGAAARRLPLDFVSLHNYNLYPGQTLAMARWTAERLRRHKSLAGVQIHFDEYNSWMAVVPNQRAFKRSVKNAAYAAATFGAFSEAGVARACYSSPHPLFARWGTTLVEPDGTPRPILAAFQLFNRLAGRRVAARVDRPQTGAGVLAALDSGTARVALWAYAAERPHDASPIALTARLELVGLPGPDGDRTVRLWRIDRPRSEGRTIRVEGGRAKLAIEIELPSVLLIEVSRG